MVSLRPDGSPGPQKCPEKALETMRILWTGGPNVVIRYYEAHPVDGERVKICAVARLAKGNMRKLPGSKPGNALLEFSRTRIFLVDEFL